MADKSIDNGTNPPGQTVVVGGNSGTNNLYLGATVTNQGTIELAGSNANASANVVIGVPDPNTTFRDGNVTLTGGGTVVGDDVAGNNIGTFSTGGFYGSFAGTLDNVNNTVKGSLTFDSTGSGGAVFQVTNESGGTINASDATNPMIFAASGLTNRGLIEDTGMAGLALEGAGVLDQTGGGTLQAVGAGAHVDLAIITVAGGTLNTSGGGVIQVDPNAPGVNGFNELDGSKSALTLTAGSTVNVLPNATLDVAGTLVNQGTISLTGTPAAGGSAFQLAGPTILRGGGTVSLGNNNLINANGNATVDNVDNTITGSGTIAGGFGFTNEAGGTINATDASNRLYVEDAITNKGLIEDTGAGSLVLASTVDQTGGGTLEAVGAGTSVVFGSQARIEGGTLTSTGGGVLVATSDNRSASVIDGTTAAVTLTAGSTVNVAANSTLVVTGALTNQGAISLTGNNSSGLQFSGATTLRGGGTIALGVANGINASDGNATVDNVDNTITGSGTIAGGFSFTNEAGGTINATGQQLLIRNNIINNGLLESTSGPLNVQANITQNGSGTIAANGAASEVVLYNNTVTGGTLTSSAGGLIDIGSQGNETLAGNATLTSSANVLVENGANLFVTQAAALGGVLNVGGNANGGAVYIDGAMKAAQAVNSLLGTGSVVAYDSANPAQPQTVTLTIGGDGSTSNFAGLITQQSTASLALVKAGAGTFTLSGANSYAGGTTIAAGVLDLGVANAAGTAAITFAGSNTAEATLRLETAAQPASGGTFGSTLARFGNDDALDLVGFANGIVQYDPILSPHTLTVTNGNRAETFTLANPGSLAFLAQSDGNGGTLISDGVSAVCFAQGTQIRTTHGDKTVECLTVGDRVITVAGEERPICWLGHRSVDCRRHPRPHEVMPVRVTAHAFGEGRPARDLVVSPGHAICVDLLGEVLIPAGALVNGTTIARQDVDQVTYWHVELEGGQEILLAENMPCESYLDMGNRTFFAQGGIVDFAASPDARVLTHGDFCRPFHQDGPLVAFVHDRLATRALDLGWTLAHKPLADLHLIVDGRRIDAEAQGLSARFLLPADAEGVWLVSDTSVPAEIGMAPDLRRLGVCVGALVVDDGFGKPRTIPADDPRLCVGFHHAEEGPQRWTAGHARLPVHLWEGCRESFFLRVELARPTLPRWVAPSVRVCRGEQRAG